MAIRSAAQIDAESKSAGQRDHELRGIAPLPGDGHVRAAEGADERGCGRGATHFQPK